MRWGEVPRSRLAGVGSKPPQAAVVKSHGGERWGKGLPRGDQVGIKETNVSKPLKKCRKRRDGVKTRRESLAWDESGRSPAYCPGGVRHEGGVTLIQA